MKIALLSPVAWRTPPRKYGPWEQVVSVLAEGLVQQNIDVHLFATGDSMTNGTLESVIEVPYAENPGADVKVNECLHISHLMERADEFDIIHNNYDFLPLTYSRLIKTPMITTIHGFSSPLIVPVYKKYNGHCRYIAISNANRHPDLDYAATIYNGIPVEQFTFRDTSDGYLLFFGRIHPEKGAWDAIQVARQAGMKLVIAGLIQDEGYFKEKVEPFINGDDIVYAGNCGPEERDALLGGALALLHLIHFDEPFGLSVAEAMCCGTPVIAFNRGSMPELIIHGSTGFLVATIEEAVNVIPALSTLSRQTCRDHAVRSFSTEKMTADYVNIYQQML